MDERLAAGLGVLRSWGAAPVGFCPPAWLSAPGLHAAAQRAGLRYVVTLRGLRDLHRRRWLILPPRGYMGAGARQELGVQLGGLLIAAPLTRLLRSPAHRILLHPQQAATSRACAAILRRVERLARTHRSTTYAELLDA